jgi:hypothetical protein
LTVLVRKAAFVLVTVFTRPAGMASQIIAAVLVLILSLSAHIHFSPYDHDTHDKLESASLHANLITLPVALLANEMSAVYGTGSIGEGGQQILGPLESAVFTLTAFSTFGLFVYYFLHGVLMENVEEPGLMGKLSRRICKCCHKKDELGNTIWAVGGSQHRSKLLRKRNIAKLIEAGGGKHGGNGANGGVDASDLMSLGFSTDEVGHELQRHIKRKHSQGSESNRVKVQPILPRTKMKRPEQSMVQAGLGFDDFSDDSKKMDDEDHAKPRSVDAVSTMGAAYLDLLPCHAISGTGGGAGTQMMKEKKKKKKKKSKKRRSEEEEDGEKHDLGFAAVLGAKEKTTTNDSVDLVGWGAGAI